MDYTLKDIHNEDLNIMKEFIKICEQYDLKYYIIGGTFLGAIRHKGFIPWDDDMDIAMPRKDYNKFLEIADDNLPKNMRISTFKNDDNNKYYIAKIVNKDIVLKEKTTESKGGETNLFIDVFSIDGTPNNSFIRKIYYLKILFYRLLIKWCYMDEIHEKDNRKNYEKILILIGKILPTKKIINPKKVLNRIDKLLQKYSYEKSNNVGTIMGSYKTREIVPKEYFGNPTEYSFENLKLKGPQMYHEYLTHMYGNYMEIPKNKYNNQHLIFKEEE